MTMYHRQNATHGILNAALLVDQLKKAHAGEISQAEDIRAYEPEMQERTHVTVLRNRQPKQSALDGHDCIDWDTITDSYSLVGAKALPAIERCPINCGIS